MGAALYIALEKDIPDVDPFVDGKALSTAEKRLDALAKKLGVTALMDDFSVDPQDVLDFFESEAEATGEPMQEVPPFAAEKWFDPAEGLRTVRALRSYLITNTAELRNTKAVLRDLDDFEKVLDNALSHGVRWHLAVDF